MPASGRELQLRNAILNSTSGQLKKESLLRELNLTSSHYDKLSNVLLKKAYCHLAGDDVLKQLDYLSKKYMFQHLFHEMRQYRIRIKADYADQTVPDRICRALFDYSVNVPAPHFEEELAISNANDYLNLPGDCGTREFEVKAKLLFSRINVYMHRAPTATMAAQMKRQIISLEKQFAHVDDPDIKTILYYTWANYYRTVEPNWMMRQDYLDSIAQLHGGYSMMACCEQANYDCYQAEILYERGRFREAYDAYTTAFSENLSILRNQFHHVSRWIELAIIIGDFNEAKALLDDLLKVYVDNRHESNGVIGAILYAQLYLLKGDLAQAFEYISLAQSLNSLKVYFNYEIRIRKLEACYFALIGDYEFAALLSQRNTRYIHLHQLSVKTYQSAHIFCLLKEYCKVKRNNSRKLTEKSLSYLHELDNGFEKFFGLVMNRIIKKTTSVAPAFHLKDSARIIMPSAN